MSVSIDAVRAALGTVVEPDLHKDIISLDLVSDIRVNGNDISFVVQVHNPAMHARKRMQEACEFAIHRSIGKEFTVHADIQPLGSSRAPEQRAVLPGVKHIIAVGSGKGGVGKSTVTANLAAGMAQRGYRVGLVDADIYGPSVPTMFDCVFEKPQGHKEGARNYILPLEHYGVKLLSIGFFANPDQAVVWRGPMASKALGQMFTDAWWGSLDFMFVDLPPGTGDIHLTLIQQVPLSGAIVVSTPQEVALADARKAVSMFRLPEINIPVIGVVENMAWFTPEELPDNRYYIFGKDGVRQLAENMHVPLLGQIPLVQGVRESGDAGRPAVLQNGTVTAGYFEQLLDALLVQIGEKQAERVSL
jgi:ATP-binding protein involved in chromosome partitioning